MAVTISEIVNFTGSDSEFNLYPQMDERYGPYDSVSAALTALTTSRRCVGLTIGVKSDNSITEYWFKDGVSDSNLVEKADSTYQNYKSNSGDKTKDDFYSTLTKIVDTSTYVILHANADNVKVEVTLSDGEVIEIGSSSTTSTTSTTSTQPPSQLAYLQLDTKDLDVSLPEGSRTVNVSISNGDSTSFVLNGDTVHYSYSGMGGTIGSKVTLSLPLSTYEQVVGFYDSKTGELLSNEQEYEFDTPSDGMSYVTIKFKGSDSTTTSTTTTSTEVPIP